MTFRLAVFSLCFLLAPLFAPLLAAPAYAQSQSYDVRPQARQITGAELIQSFKGITHTGAYNFDVRGRPGSLYSEKHHANGRISYTEKNQLITGRWAISPSDNMCYAYDSDNISGGCFAVYKLGTCYYFYSSSVLVANAEAEREAQKKGDIENYWTARSVKKGDHASCENMVS